VILKEIQKDLNFSVRNTEILTSFYEKIELFITECRKELKNAYKFSKKLQRNAQLCLTDRNYDKLIQTLEKHNLEFPVGSIAQEAATWIKGIMPYCDRNVLHKVVNGCKHLFELTYHYHHITLINLPIIKLQIQQLQNNSFALEAGSYHIEKVYNQYLSGEFDEQVKLVKTEYDTKRKEISHIFV